MIVCGQMHEGRVIADGRRARDARAVRLVDRCRLAVAVVDVGRLVAVPVGLAVHIAVAVIAKIRVAAAVVEVAARLMPRHFRHVLQMS